MDQEERQDLVGRLFALMTGKLEDAAELAARGQGRETAAAEGHALAEQLRDAAEEVLTIAEATTAIVLCRISIPVEVSD